MLSDLHYKEIIQEIKWWLKYDHPKKLYFHEKPAMDESEGRWIVHEEPLSYFGETYKFTLHLPLSLEYNIKIYIEDGYE